MLAVGAANFYTDSDDSGFDVASQYLMLPPGQTRRIRLVTPPSPEPFFIRSLSSSPAELKNFVSISGKFESNGQGIKIDGDSIIAFDALAKQPGLATINVDAPTPAAGQQLNISVKTQKTLTYKYYNITDLLRPPRPGVIAYMNKAVSLFETHYLKWCNIALRRAAPIENIKVNRILRPTNWAHNFNDGQPPSAIPFDVSSLENVSAIQSATPAIGSNLTFYNCWGLESFLYPKIRVIGWGGVGIPTFFGDLEGRVDSFIASNTVHEIGHALGLKHFFNLTGTPDLFKPDMHNSFTDTLAMWPFIGGTKFLGFEIDYMNTSSRFYHEYY